MMDRAVVSWPGMELPEYVSFLCKSGAFLIACAAMLYVSLAASYPSVHDTLHNFRHALAVVPCH